MFNNKDYCKFTHGLMAFGVMFGYNTVFEHSRKDYFSWVDVSLSRNIHKKPPLNPDLFSLTLTLFLVGLALFITLLRCYNRITENKVHWKVGLKEWGTTFAGYVAIFLILLVVWPPFYKLLRGW